MAVLPKSAESQIAAGSYGVGFNNVGSYQLVRNPISNQS